MNSDEKKEQLQNKDAWPIVTNNIPIERVFYHPENDGEKYGDDYLFPKNWGNFNLKLAV